MRETLCPLCGQSNLCALTQGQSIDQCWCLNAKVPRALPKRRDACLCQTCLQRLAEEEALGIKRLDA
ncbi:cysteine-rich CWC family protein [Shewanella sedimentimangrovi]|uniref:Cysteine-rich CWC family protein n=1 Tax=Shewanella sedimentimangrovi TaxID=2814293 RepID=A0ABX7QZ14_9GAMM|nr:cysteine-rich CWC family protein [Shewanella sedimentimangrovi]QSX36783.1 cysteine-rich CWC family protein [Shewanella sedimentimangrovi]